jgi:hypothetical protein
MQMDPIFGTAKLEFQLIMEIWYFNTIISTTDNGKYNLAQWNACHNLNFSW